MPEICRFYGIIVRMYNETGVRHHAPHIHVYYQDDMAVYGINPIQLLAGQLPHRQRRLVESWMAMHQRELAKNWDLIDNGQMVNRIAPLRK